MGMSRMPVYRYYDLTHREVHRDRLVASWEIFYSAMSDDFTPLTCSADQLFCSWVEKVEGMYINNQIPIYWSVKGELLSEAMPLQAFEGANKSNFLTYFCEPVDDKTHQPIDWYRLPVIDKAWNHEVQDTGGFIQEVTGWKPTALQPFVELDFLLAMAEQVPQQVAG